MDTYLGLLGLAGLVLVPQVVVQAMVPTKGYEARSTPKSKSKDDEEPINLDDVLTSILFFWLIAVILFADWHVRLAVAGFMSVTVFFEMAQMYAAKMKCLALYAVFRVSLTLCQVVVMVFMVFELIPWGEMPPH